MATNNTEHIDLDPPGSHLRHSQLNGLPTGQDTESNPPPPVAILRLAMHRGVEVEMDSGSGFPPVAENLWERANGTHHDNQSHALHGSACESTARTDGSLSKPPSDASGASRVSHVTSQRGNYSPLDQETGHIEGGDRPDSSPPVPASSPRPVAIQGAGADGILVRGTGAQFDFQEQVGDVVEENPSGALLARDLV